MAWLFAPDRTLTRPARRLPAPPPHPATDHPSVHHRWLGGEVGREGGAEKPQGFDTGKNPQTRRADATRIRSAGLVATARGKHPIPSRTRPLSPVAPMVLRLKTWESRSPPDQIPTPPPAREAEQPNPFLSLPVTSGQNKTPGPRSKIPAAGWSSPVARQAHNLKVVGSNPTPATKSQAKTDS